MELDLQRMGVEYVQPATVHYSFRTFCAEERNSNEGKNFYYGKELGSGQWKEPGEESFKIQEGEAEDN